ncbi:MAG TPA: hypothetical protein VFH70_05865 [Acidimicrobiales bacterium]|nr:hypothetical protein [Acidimicrobiales bacterium]
MTVGFGLAGAWRRDGLVVDGVRVTDPCEVLWLQTPEWYADIRLPAKGLVDMDKGPTSLFAEPWAFAGTASWDPPTMTWEHQFDSRAEAAVDANPLVKVGELLVEEGWVAYGERRVPFVEEWRKISTSNDPVSAVVRPDGVQVTVGPWRITVSDRRPVSDFLARREEYGSSGWAEVGRLLVPPRRSSVGVIHRSP